MDRHDALKTFQEAWARLKVEAGQGSVTLYPPETERRTTMKTIAELQFIDVTGVEIKPSHLRANGGSCHRQIIISTAAGEVCIDLFSPHVYSDDADEPSIPVTF
jgi:hypothetical protein